ncbi:sugar phosphate isomerase/epimerase [Alphaproteobacteria bacterium]|nr:sugar phosphate isomerase/epimerase [Alphaproteobacteria bacterium]
MIPTIATVSLGGEIKKKLQAISKAGFHSIELFDADLDTFEGHAKELKNLIRDFGLSLASYFPLRNFEGMPEGQKGSIFDQAKYYLNTAKELGSEMVMICSNTSQESLPNEKKITSDLNELAEIAKNFEIKLAYEALAWGIHVNDYRHAMQLIQDADHMNLGIALDTFHIMSKKDDITQIRHIPREKIYLVQISDAPFLDLDYLSWSRSHRILPGYGDFDLKSFVKEVKLTGYDQYFSLECFNKNLQAKDPINTAAEGFILNQNLWN